MAWDSQRKFYYRAQRIDGKPKRIYVGGGRAAIQAAEEDRQRREQREREREEVTRLFADLVSQATAIELVARFGEALGYAALYATGHHQHNKGEWRKKRG